MLDLAWVSKDAREVTNASLADLTIGQSAEIVDVQGDPELVIRLLEMGFVPGTRVELIKRAPFGDPLEFQIRGYHVSLRRAEAAFVRMVRA